MNLPFRFTFRPLMASQRELIKNALKQDYISEWIHGVGLQNTLTSLEKFIQYQALGKGLERDSKITQHWIGYDRGEPFVYLLTSNLFNDDSNNYAAYRETKGLAITLDIFMIDPKLMGKGYASIVIREFLLSQFSDISEIFIDPEKTNEKAIHVYEKVGFLIVGEFIAPWHPVPHLIMRLGMKDLKG